MKDFGYTILVIIIVIIVSAIIKSIGTSAERSASIRKYYKTIDNSTGLEKIRLIIREQAMRFAGRLDIGITIPVLETHRIIADMFYGGLNESYEKITKQFEESAATEEMARKTVEQFDALAEEIQGDRTKQQVIAARVFGVSFGIVLSKAAKESHKKIKKTAVKNYISASKIDEALRNEIIKTALLFIKSEEERDYIEDGLTSRELGAIAYSMLDKKLGKKHYADPLIASSIDLAILAAYRNTDVSFVMDGLTKEGLIG